MPQTDSKPGETNRPSYHASHRWKQITGNKSYAPPWLTQTPATHKQQIIWIPTNHRQQILYLTMAHTHTRNSRAAKRSSCHASHIYQQITGKNRTSYHASDTSKSQATKHTCYAFHGNLQITGNKSYIFPLPHTNASNTQATHHTSYNVSYRYQKITGHLANKSYILPCLTLIPANPGNKS